MMADYETLVEVRNWNLDAMRRAEKAGNRRDAWRHSDNAERLRAYLAKCNRIAA
jgi:hypothetical protein